MIETAKAPTVFTVFTPKTQLILSLVFGTISVIGFGIAVYSLVVSESLERRRKFAQDQFEKLLSQQREITDQLNHSKDTILNDHKNLEDDRKVTLKTLQDVSDSVRALSNYFGVKK
jgi:glucose-6-phosphate-specific signal transduction histidine kinase